MKKLLLTIALGLFAFVGTATTSEARPHYGHGYYRDVGAPFFSHYHHGRAIYKQRYIAGYRPCGTPIYRYRYIKGQRSHYHQSSNRCDSGYGGKNLRYNRSFRNWNHRSIVFHF